MSSKSWAPAYLLLSEQGGQLQITTVICNRVWEQGGTILVCWSITVSSIVIKHGQLPPDVACDHLRPHVSMSHQDTDRPGGPHQNKVINICNYGENQANKLYFGGHLSTCIHDPLWSQKPKVTNWQLSNPISASSN